MEINLTFGDSHANKPMHTHWGNGLAMSKSGVIQNKLKKASQIPRHDLLSLCVHTPHQPGLPLCGHQHWGSERTSILKKKNIDHSSGLLSSGHCKHKILGLFYLEGQDATF